MTTTRLPTSARRCARRCCGRPRRTARRIGALIGGPQGALGFLVFALLLNLVFYWFSDKIALRAARAQPVSEEDDPRLYQMVRELTTRAGLPMPKLYVIPQEQPNAFATGRNPSHSAVAVTAGIRKLLSEDELRGVLAHELGHVRNHDILLTSVASAIGSAITWIAYTLLWFGGDNDSPLGAIGAHRAGPARAARRGDHPDGDLAPAGVLGGRHRRRDLRQPRVPGLCAAAARGGLAGDPDAGQPGPGAALHRQAVQRRRLRLALLDASANRGAGPPAAPDAADHRLRSPPDASGISDSESRDAFWRPSNQMRVENTDLAKQLEAKTLGARLWRLHPGRPPPGTGTSRPTSSTCCSRGRAHAGRRRARSPCEPLSAVLVEPEHLRQFFNDTEEDALWLVVGAPREERQRAPWR